MLLGSGTTVMLTNRSPSVGFPSSSGSSPFRLSARVWFTGSAKLLPRKMRIVGDVVPSTMNLLSVHWYTLPAMSKAPHGLVVPVYAPTFVRWKPGLMRATLIELGVAVGTLGVGAVSLPL